MGKNFSGANRGQRKKSDFYETPYSMTRRFLDEYTFTNEVLESNMSRRGKPNLNKRKSIEIDGKIYRGAEEPAKIYGVGCATITKWAREGIKARYV